MKRPLRATALLLLFALLLFSFVSCGESGTPEAKTVFDAMEQTFLASAIQQTDAFQIVKAATQDGSFSLSYAPPSLTKTEDALSYWQINFRDSVPSYLSFRQAERSCALWLKENKVIALPHGADAVATDPSKLPALPVGALQADTEAARGTLSFLELARDLVSATAQDEALSDRLAETVQKNASVSRASDEAGQHYSFLFSEATIGTLFADVAQIARGSSAVRYALTAFLEHLYETEEMQLPENLFSEEGVARIKQDLAENGTLSMLAKFTLKDGTVKAVRCVLRNNQTETFHMNVSLSDLENGSAEILSLSKTEAVDRKISWSCEKNGDFSIHTLRIGERAPGETDYSPKLSIETQYNEKRGTLSGNVSMGGLLGVEFMGMLEIGEGTLRFFCDQFRLHYGFLSHSFSAFLELNLFTAPAKTEKAPEATGEWTELTEAELEEVYRGLYPILRSEQEEKENPFEDLIPDFEDLLEGILPLES